jgi:hypothetical protein
MRRRTLTPNAATLGVDGEARLESLAYGLVVLLGRRLKPVA